MTVGKILLAAKDSEYGRALARAVSSLHNEFEISLMNLEANGKAKPGRKLDFPDYDLILLDGYAEDDAEAFREKRKDGSRIVLLSEYNVESLVKQSEKNDAHFWYLYKYTDLNQIISDLNYLIGSVAGRKSLVRKGFEPELIGFYSISGGSGKSVIALGTSRELSRYHDKKVLYLSFEEIPASELFVKNSSDNRNIGDYLYYLFERKNENLCSRTKGFTSSDEFGVDFFPPSNGRNDLNDLTQEELIYFLKTVSDSCRYDYIALDLKSDLTEETLFLLDLCGKIIFVRSEDPVSRFKSRKCIAYLDGISSFQNMDRFLLAVNKAESTECGGEEKETFYTKNLRKISIEKDDDSFRFVSDHLDIDISHSFGIGIKKIAEEILCPERAGRQNGCFSDAAYQSAENI